MKIVFVSNNEIDNEDLENIIYDNLDCEELDISENPLSDISCLARLRKLKILDLHDTKVINISVLNELKSTLTNLNLADISLEEKNFGILESLTQVESLNLKRTSIGASIKCLSSLQKLQNLDLSGIKIDFTAVGNLTNLRELNLSETSVVNLTCLSELTKLEILDLSLTKVFILSPLALLPSLRKLYLLDTPLDPQILLQLKASISLTEIIVDNDSNIQAVKRQVLQYIEEKRVKVAQSLLEEKEIDESQSIEIPHYFKCPITKDWIRDPVPASDGYSYERAQILSWYQLNGTSPVTRQPISDPAQSPTNRYLKDAIEDILLKKYPELKLDMEAQCSAKHGNSIIQNKILIKSLTENNNSPSVDLINSASSEEVIISNSPPSDVVRETDFRKLKKQQTLQNIAREENWNPLMIAVYMNDLEKVQQIIREDRDSTAISHRDRLGANALLQTATYGRIRIFDWLTSEEVENWVFNKKELNLNVCDFDRHTPFLVAAYTGELDFIKHLITKYPDRNFLNEKDRFNRNAIQIADYYRQTAVSSFLRQFRKKIDNMLPPQPSNLSQEIKTSQNMDIKSYVNFNISSEDKALAEQEKWTPLFIAIYRDQLDKVKKIVMEDKNSICHRDRLGGNALLLAAVYGKKNIFDWFVSEEAKGLQLDAKELNLNVINFEKQTPFLAAVYGGQLDFIKYLLDKYSFPIKDFFVEKDRHGRNAIQIANFYKHMAVSDFLRKLSESKAYLKSRELMLKNTLNLWENMPSHEAQESQFTRNSKITLNQEAKKFGFKCKDVDRRGNCFFLAVISQLHSKNLYLEATHENLRALATEHILNNFKLYRDKIEGNIDEFIEKISTDATWADEIIIRALSCTLNITIVIIRSDGANPHIFRRKNPVITIYLGYEVGQHYQSLLSESTEINLKLKELITVTEIDPFENTEVKSVIVERVQTISDNKSNSLINLSEAKYVLMPLSSPGNQLPESKSLANLIGEQKARKN